MVAVRWIVALATVAYALWGGLPAVTTALFKLNSLPSGMVGETQRYVALMQQASLWLVVAWLLADLLFLFAALRLVTRPREAFGPFLIAFLINLVVAFVAYRLPAWGTTYSAQDMQYGYAILGGLVVALIAYFAFGRTRVKRTQPTLLMD
jgi:hypothetical protein